jgi:hypothetical protein
MKKTPLIILFVLCSIAAQAQLSRGDTLLFNSFKQDEVKVPAASGGNCVSIALIKTAIGTFGLGKVFGLKTDSVKQIYQVTLRNGKVLQLSFDEVASATQKAHFFLKIKTAESVAVYNYANLCFAVMCKKLQADTNITLTYEQAVDRLNEGYVTLNIPELLGIKITRIMDLSLENLKAYRNLVVWYEAHTVYYSLGYYDEESYKYSGIVPLEEFHHCYFTQRLLRKCHPEGAFSLN